MQFVFNALLLLLPLGEILRFAQPNGSYLRILDLVVLVNVLWGLKIIHKTASPLKKPLLLFVTALILSLLINFFAANLNALLYLVRTITYLTFFYITTIFKQTKKELHLSRTFFSWNLLILFLLAYTQYISYPDLRNLYYLGYDPHSSRLFGSLLDPNLMGIITVWALLYTYYGNFRTKYKYISAILLTGALLLTYSRISWICFVLAVLCITLQKNKKIGLFLITSFTLLIFLLPRQFGEGTNIWRTNSITAKIGTLTQAKELILQSPLVGKGFNTVPVYKTEKASNNLKTIPDNSKYSFDNSLLTLLVTTGIVGIISYLYLFWNLYKYTAMPGKILTITFFLHALSTNSFFTPTTFIYFCLFYLFMRQEKRI